MRSNFTVKFNEAQEKLDNHIKYNKGTTNYEKILGHLNLKIESMKEKHSQSHSKEKT